MLDDFTESAEDMPVEVDRISAAYRWSKQSILTAVLALSITILALSVLALLFLGIPIALIAGLLAGSWPVAEQTMAQLWRLSPALLAAIFVLAWLLIGLFVVLRRALDGSGAVEA